MAHGWLDLDSELDETFAEAQSLSPCGFDREEVRGFRVVWPDAPETDKPAQVKTSTSVTTSPTNRELSAESKRRANERRRERRMADIEQARAKEAEKALRWWNAHKDEANKRRVVLGRLKREQAAIAAGQMSLVLDAESGVRLTSSETRKGEGDEMRRSA